MPNPPLIQWLENLFSSDAKGAAYQRRGFAPVSSVGKSNGVVKEQFESQLENIILQHPTVTTGRIQLINLEQIREKLGDKWEKKSQVAHQIVCTAIERRLAPDDIYSQYSELAYVIVFANLDKRQAQLKSVLIAKEISLKILGKDVNKDFIEVSTLVAKADGQATFEKLPTISELVHELEKPLAHEATALEENKDSHPLKNEDIQFVFRPIWFAKQHVISTFLCIPVTSTSNGGYLSSYSVLDNPDDTTQIFELDILAIMKVNKELVRLHNEHKTALFALPVHFETLADHNRRSIYFKKCNTILKGAENQIIFEVIGLPEGVPDTRIAEILSPLKPLSRSVLARFSIEHQDFTGYHSAGIHAVGVDLYEIDEDEKELIKAMNKFVEAANKNSLKTYVHGVRSLSLNTAAVTSGFDYIDGYVLTSASESVESAYFLEIENLYKT